MADADLNRIIAELERRAKLIDEMIERSVTNSSERERLRKRADESVIESRQSEGGNRPE